MTINWATVYLQSCFSASRDIPQTEPGFKSRDASLVNWTMGYRRQKRSRFQLQVLNLFDSKDSDTCYSYASRLQDEAAGGLEDMCFRPVESRFGRVD
ncbi:hypothetical protein [Methylomicrobium sp. Wu6]|uniref:hypothetical protein n=1 Tax=Methylomicrobium sp. Wu6 TaxID=3107928 RepID=UPI002DD67FA9|nr:hypothetical protein [Methylomicrobium sp. Wu6]MEC4748188.1 hypothetical protein [Methylomicrobium sp. Wu6]